MSKTTQSDAEAFGQMLRQYKPGSGSDRYARFVRHVLDLRTPEIQRQILEALAENRRVCAVAANGVGKSYIAAAGGIAALYTNADTTVNVTSGSYGQLDDTIWKPLKSIHRQSGLPGRTLDNTRELRSGLDDEWYLKCLSPRNPGDLEGRHNKRMIYIIEEADKPGITHNHIDSAESTLTDSDDRMLVIANPPADEGNVVSDLMDSEKWETLQFASWDSHNVNHPDDKIPGLVDETEIRENWEEWNGEAWPGLNAAIEQTAERTDLDTRWYRRRAGRVPPERADVWRPWSISDVEQAYQRTVRNTRETPDALGVDVADKVDTTKAVGLHGPTAVIEYDSQASLPQQQKDLLDMIQEWPPMDGRVDAIGRGAQLAQELESRFPDFEEFGNNEVATDDEYRHKWGHGLQLIGEWLRDGGSFDDRNLYEQLKVGARVIEFERNHLSSRGKVIEATSKEVLKDELGYSPDTLDALLMALYARETDATSSDKAQSMTWGY